MKRETMVFIVSAGLALAPGASGWAQAPGDEAAPDEPTAEEQAADEEAGTPAGAQRVTQRLATEFNVPAEQVTSLREEGMGYGEIHHALSLAEQMPGGITDANVDQIVTMRQEQKMGWGRIAQELGTKLGPATKRGAQQSPVAEPAATQPAPSEPTSTTGDTGTTTQTESLQRPGASKAKGGTLGSGSRGVGVERSGGKAKGFSGNTHGGGAGVGHGGFSPQGKVSAPGHNR